MQNKLYNFGIFITFHKIIFFPWKCYVSIVLAFKARVQLPMAASHLIILITLLFKLHNFLTECYQLSSTFYSVQWLQLNTHPIYKLWDAHLKLGVRLESDSTKRLYELHWNSSLFSHYKALAVTAVLIYSAAE